MKNPFNHENYPSNELKRNTFPCSFQNNLTMKYGYIYPAGIWRTVPGATYKIRPTLGLNFMPTTFPVQTRQKVYVHYFYGRDRNFWKDYKDFVNGQRPDLVKPYIDESVTQARTGKLLDYLGVPTTLVGRYGNTSKELVLETDSPTQNLIIDPDVFHYINPIVGVSAIQWFQFMSIDEKVGINLNIGRSSDVNLPNNEYPARCTFIGKNSDFNNNYDIRFNVTLKSTSTLDVWTNVAAPQGYQPFSPNPTDTRYIAAACRLIAVDDTGTLVSIVSPVQDGEAMQFDISTESSSDLSYYFVCPTILDFGYNLSDNSYRGHQLQALDGFSRYVEVIYSSTGVKDIDSLNSPYWRQNDDRNKETIKLNAYLPRFYETVYNLYYRNPQNNPYILDGRPEYNKFIPSKDGGVDSNLYQLRRRNWEDDFLTTAVQSPQQGIAPLVGLTDRGATLTLTNEDGTVTRYNVTTTDNGSITGIEANDTSAEPVLTKALIDAVSYGISIEDIRNVNAMQKWLELNLRKGYQYKDIIQARWGISISYNELDLPEFIGGFTKDVQLQAVTQTANVNDDVTGQLGWQAGRLFASGEGREITHYCDEEGYIMCLITVVPVPNYSQLLPKHWFERDLLDSYQPEFNHIGFQPITYKEVCPVQAYQESTENVNVLEQTFGYQRPWYQYFNYTDEVHGQFRTTFKDFLINRVFDVKPELSESFLLVDPEQINDVFNVPDADDDKIIGAIYHNCIAKLPISLYAQARLE